jgi:CheY-like chemotaxis protein
MSNRILVVEDQPDNRQIIRDMLAPTDYEITDAENGEQALAAIAKQRPDLIVMDIQLPIMDGYTATSRIKADPALRSIPIIAAPPMRSVAKKRRRGRSAVTITQGLAESGWIIGRNVRIDYRWYQSNAEAARAYAVELLALTPDIIVVAPKGRQHSSNLQARCRSCS